MAVTACQDRHETPRTDLGLPGRPGTTDCRTALHNAARTYPLAKGGRSSQRKRQSSGGPAPSGRGRKDG
jgi:hypothetical protein